MHNAGRYRSALRIAVICGCLLLAFAVFAWGLHAKLSLYDAHAVPSTVTVAKLLTSQKTGRELVGPVAPAVCPELHELAFCFVAALIVAPLLRLYRLRGPILSRRSYEDPDRPAISSRPPPFGAGALLTS